jgi:hypothetical protein
MSEVVCEIERLADDGVKEVMLLGQNVDSYRDPAGHSFADLLKAVNRIDGIERIRFMTSHPKDCTIELLDTIRDCKKISRHLHLPFQSGSSRILKLMNRYYDRNQYLELIKWVCKSSGVERLQITNLEDYQCLSPCENLSWTESVEQIVNIARDCLRERYWCRLHAHNFFIHFGYDYYLYMGTQLDYLQMHCIANNLGVFVEKMSSPYCVLSSE